MQLHGMEWNYARETPKIEPSQIFVLSPPHHHSLNFRQQSKTRWETERKQHPINLSLQSGHHGRLRQRFP